MMVGESEHPNLKYITAERKQVYIQYESQTYISFNGEKEFERVQEISKFIAEVNSKYNYKAKHIPVVPEMLIDSVMADEFGVKSDNNRMVIGLNFADVTPAVLDFSKQDVLAVSGGYTESKDKDMNRCWIFLL